MNIGINKPNEMVTDYADSLPYKDVCKAVRYNVPNHDGYVPGVKAGDDVNFDDMKPVPKKGGY